MKNLNENGTGKESMTLNNLGNLLSIINTRCHCLLSNVPILQEGIAI
jgi:hypothetical protein